MINTVSERNVLVFNFTGSPFARLRSILENTAANIVITTPEAKPARKFVQKLDIELL
jgi:hypothetical protein